MKKFTEQEVKDLRDRLVVEGKERLHKAQEYMATFCDEWDDTHEEAWLDLINAASSRLDKVAVLNELLKEV